jgi:hypothetical protein
VIRIGPTRDEKRYAALRQIGCIACVLKGYTFPCGHPEIHHLVDKGYRKHSGGNQATIPLGPWHHRGEPRIDYTATEMRAIWGPSMFAESKEFARLYGSQRDLLAKVNELLASSGKDCDA